MTIRFFEQLAPAPATSAASAYAPVPPRFAPSRTELDLEEERFSVPAPRDVEVQSSSVEFQARATSPISVVAQAPAALEHEPHPAAPPSELRRDVASTQATAPTRAIMRAASTAMSATPSPLLPRRATSDSEAPSGVGPRAAVLALPLIEGAPSQTIGEPSSTPTVRPPLRERAATQVSGPPRGEPHSVVHVTIDRIEVRAPAAPPPALASQSKARTPSSKSLGEYLRERNRAGGAMP